MKLRAERRSTDIGYRHIWIGSPILLLLSCYPSDIYTECRERYTSFNFSLFIPNISANKVVRVRKFPRRKNFDFPNWNFKNRKCPVRLFFSVSLEWVQKQPSWTASKERERKKSVWLHHVVRFIRSDRRQSQEDSAPGRLSSPVSPTAARHLQLDVSFFVCFFLIQIADGYCVWRDRLWPWIKRWGHIRR